MTEASESYAAVIGDVVASRRAPRRDLLQEELGSALELANELVAPVQPLQITIGDEFQGLYRSTAEALQAALVVRFAMIGTAAIRFGIGSGELYVVDPERVPFGQDGPAWWAARQAISSVKDRRRSREAPGLATAYVDGDTLVEQVSDPAAAVRQDLVNGILVARDALIARMDDRDARIALGLLTGRRQEEIATVEGVSQSAISQRVVGAGIAAVLEAQRLCMRGVEWPT